MDNPVITVRQAKEITGGRTPLIPVVYEEALMALAACREIDEAKTWNNAADALAAWAKIYHSDRAAREAKLLRLHAYRRMGELARELRPGGHRVSDSPSGKLTVQLPGPRSLLMEKGLRSVEASAAIKISRVETPAFEEVTRRPRIPSPVVLAQETGPKSTRICSELALLASRTRNLSPAEFLKNPPRIDSRWRENAEEVYEWLGLILKRHD